MKTKNLKRTILFLAIAFLFYSCSSLDISTIKNPEKKLSDTSGYIVFFDNPDIGLRTELENNIVKNFSAKGKLSKESIVLFPPIKDYESSEIRQKCLENGLNLKVLITTIDKSSETATTYTYAYSNGVMIPIPISATSTHYIFDIIVQDLRDNEIIIHSTLNSEDGSLKYIISKIADKIVNEILNEECKEFISIMNNLSEKQLEIVSTNKTKYTITGKTKLGEINLNNGVFEIKLPISFGSVEDSKGIAEKVVKENSSYYLIKTNNADDLPYITELLKEYDQIKK